MEAVSVEKRGSKVGRDPSFLFRKVIMPALMKNANVDMAMQSIGVDPPSRDPSGYDDMAAFSGYKPTPQVRAGGDAFQALRRARSGR